MACIFTYNQPEPFGRTDSNSVISIIDLPIRVDCSKLTMQGCDDLHSSVKCDMDSDYTQPIIEGLDDFLYFQFNFFDFYNDWDSGSPTHGVTFNNPPIGDWLVNVRLLDGCCKPVCEDVVIEECIPDPSTSFEITNLSANTKIVIAYKWGCQYVPECQNDNPDFFNQYYVCGNNELTDLTAYDSLNTNGFSFPEYDGIMSIQDYIDLIIQLYIDAGITDVIITSPDPNVIKIIPSEAFLSFFGLLFPGECVGFCLMAFYHTSHIGGMIANKVFSPICCDCLIQNAPDWKRINIFIGGSGIDITWTLDMSACFDGLIIVYNYDADLDNHPSYSTFLENILAFINVVQLALYSYSPYIAHSISYWNESEVGSITIDFAANDLCCGQCFVFTREGHLPYYPEVLCCSNDLPCNPIPLEVGGSDGAYGWVARINGRFYQTIRIPTADLPTVFQFMFETPDGQVFVTEPYCKSRCVDTIKLRGLYPAGLLDCEGNFYGTPSLELDFGGAGLALLSDPLAAGLSYDNGYRFYGSKEFRSVIIERETTEYRALRNISKDQYKIRSMPLPEYAVRLIKPTLLGTLDVIINDNGTLSEMVYEGNMDKNLEAGTMWSLELTANSARCFNDFKCGDIDNLY